MNIEIIFETSEEGGYAAIVPSLPGCISKGRPTRKREKTTRIVGGNESPYMIPSGFIQNPGVSNLKNPGPGMIRLPSWQIKNWV